MKKVEGSQGANFPQNTPKPEKKNKSSSMPFFVQDKEAKSLKGRIEIDQRPDHRITNLSKKIQS